MALPVLIVSEHSSAQVPITPYYATDLNNGNFDGTDAPGNPSKDLVDGINVSDSLTIAEWSLNIHSRPSLTEPDSVDEFLYRLDEGTEPSLRPPLPSVNQSVRALSRRSSPANASSDTSSTTSSSTGSSWRSRIASLTSAGAFYSEFLDFRLYREFSMRTFCESLHNSSRAVAAKVKSVKRYGDLYGVPHRFLIFHVSRSDRDFYLRLDRRPDRTGVPLWRFGMLDFGTSIAKDTAAISGLLEHLLDYTDKKSGVEAIMVFPTPVLLSEVAGLLSDVEAESPGYKLTKENCWFFVSVVQEMLTRKFGAEYQKGSLNYPNIGSQCRNRIRVRVFSTIKDEINLLLEKILRLTALIADPMLTQAIKFILKVVGDHHESGYGSFSALDAFRISSPMRKFLTVLHLALHEHLHGCSGVPGARVFLSFSNTLLQWLQAWERLQGSSQISADDMIELVKSITSLLESPLEKYPPVDHGSPPTYSPTDRAPESCRRHETVLLALKLLGQCAKLDHLPEVWRFQMNSAIPDLRNAFGSLMTTQLKFVCRHWTTLVCESQDRGTEIMEALSQSAPVLLHWVAMMGIMGEIDRACQGLRELERWLKKPDKQGAGTLIRIIQDLCHLATQSKRALAASSLSILSSGHRFIPLGSSLHTEFSATATVKCRIVTGDIDSSERWWPLHSLKIHTNGTNSVVFSPDDRRLASASLDGIVRIWDAVTGALLQGLEGHAGQVRSVSFSRDRRYLASASDDRTVRIWDAATGALFRQLKGHTDSVRSVTFSPDGRFLASASDDCTIRIWNVVTGEPLRRLRGHSNWIRFVAFSNDGRHLASASNDRTVRVWDTATGASVRELRGHTAPVYSVAFSPDGLRLASDDRNARIWDVTTGKLLQTLDGHSGYVSSVKFSPDRHHLASASNDGTIRIWDAVTGMPLRELRGHSGAVSSVDFSSDGRYLVSASHDGTLRVWDSAIGVPLQGRKGHSGSISSTEFSPDGRHLASTSQDGTVCVWDVRSARCIRQRRLDRRLHSRRVSFSSESSTLDIQDLFPDLEGVSNPSLFPLPPTPLPVFLDHNALCIRRGDVLLHICWLPDYFEPSAPISNHGSIVCIGGKEGMVAFIDLDGLVPSSVQNLGTSG